MFLKNRCKLCGITVKCFRCSNFVLLKKRAMHAWMFRSLKDYYKVAQNKTDNFLQGFKMKTIVHETTKPCK